MNRGHIILREDRGLTIEGVQCCGPSKGPTWPDLLQPGITEELLPEPEGSDVLVSKDKLEGEIEFVAKMLLEKRAFESKDVMYLFEKLEELGNTDFRVGSKTPMTSWYTGAFVHGSVAGLRTNAKKFPNATKYLTAFAKERVGEKDVTALGITRSSALGLHRDVHNARCTTNMVLPLTKFEGGGLWIESDDVSAEDLVINKVPKKGEVSGNILQFQEDGPLSFRPNLWHEVQPWKGDRVVMLLYTPRASKLKPPDVEGLEDLGFRLERGLKRTRT